MSYIRTVLADLPPELLGVCYAHEHIIIDPSHTTAIDPSFLLDDVDIAATELRDAYSAGVRAMIDTMPGGAGRNASKLAQVSVASGIHIVCPTGMHLAKYYRPDDRRLKLDTDELAEWFIDEILEGVTDAPLRDDEPRRRAGVIKVASGRDRLSPHERRVFEAAAIAHRTTGCPIITHTEEGTAAMEQIDLFADAGVDLSRVTLSHTDRLPDVELHQALLRRGVRLEYDSCFRWKGESGNPTLTLLRTLCEAFPNQLMLGMDAARRAYWRGYGGAPGLRYLWADFANQLLNSGMSAQNVEALFVRNPAAAFAFSTSM